MGLDELAGGRAPTRRPTVARGKVAKPPATAADSMTVVLLNYSARLEYEIPAGQWTLRHDGALPAQGAHCPVIFDDDGDAWVPVYTDPPA